MDDFAQMMNDALAQQIGQLTLDKTGLQVQIELLRREIAALKAEHPNPEPPTS